MSGAVAKPKRSAPSNAAITTSRPVRSCLASGARRGRADGTRAQIQSQAPQLLKRAADVPADEPIPQRSDARSPPPRPLGPHEL